MMKTFLLTVMSVAWVSAIQLQAQCVNDTTFTDVIYLVDNSGSIDDAEYVSFESIITTSIASLQGTCPDAQVAVAHYGGFEGQELIIEHPFSTSPIPNVNRQFCNARDAFNICIGSGGDDLNHAIGALMDSMATGALTHDMNNNLSLVILTDAFGFGTNCLQPNCSLILPLTNIDALKAATGVDVTVVGVSDQAEETLLGIYASPGGDFMGPLSTTECTGTFDGCAVPRKYIPAEFNSDPNAIASIITNTVSCQVEVITALSIEAGMDQSVCTDLGQSATLTATPSMGLAPFDYSWSNGETTQSITVTPSDTTLFFVTVTDANTCSFTDSVTVFAAPCCTGFAVDAGTDQMICGDLPQSAVLNAVGTGSGTSFITYSWDNGLGAGQSQTVTPAVTTTYTVTAMSDIGCTATDDIEVQVESCCDGFSVEAGFDQMICQGLGESVNLIAVTTGGVAPVVVSWDQGLGDGLSQTVSPFVTTTYTVTATDNQGCVTTDQVTVVVEDCGPDCTPDTTFTDVIFLIDNSGSIDDVEFSAFEDIIVASLAGIESSCPSSRRSVVHYGGANGTSTTVEHPLDGATITSVNRQFCNARDQFNICVGGGGDDLNNAIGDIMTFLGDGTLNRNPLNNLSLVILTDAFSFDETCNQPNCSLILPTTNIDILKANFGADVSVIGVSEQAEETLLGIYASPGGDFQGPLFADECSGSFDGCIVPRKYVGIEFDTPPLSVADMITEFVSCQIEVMPVVDVDAGPDESVCFNLGQSVTLTATPLFGTPPFTYLWSDALATTTPDLEVTPAGLVSAIFTVTITDANTCTAVDTVVVDGISCFDCTADAGTPQPPAEVCLDRGQAILQSEPNDGVVIPDGFEELFILANRDRTILDFSIGPRDFIVTEPGIYRIHTLIAEVTNPSDSNFFDLNTIELGVSDLFFIVNCVENHEICIAFDFPGRVFEVFGPDEFMCMDFENTINLCWDGMDNDGDGLVDCADPDCAQVITCLENTLIACNDLTDNDGDGLVDCFDPDCFQFTVCAERGAACEDGIDNDGDGLIDCADSSCDGSAPCLEDSPFTCVDGRDNDGDGLVDCADPQCANFIVCAEFDAAACRDGIDNDFDGLVDCLDSDCRTVDPEFCEPFENNLEKCSDGRDNDFDGLIDCQDPDCQTQQLLAVLENLDRIIEVQNATCMGGDNGIIRFFGIAQDPSFQYSIDGSDFVSSIQFSGLAPGNFSIAIKSQFGCVKFFSVGVDRDACPEICNNNIDDDGDGLVDCDDLDCNIVEPFNPSIINIISSDCPGFNNGAFTVSGLPSDVTYTIDGENYQTSPTFTGLAAISYNLGFQDASGCHSGIIVTVPKGNDDDNDNICNEDDRCPGIDDWIIGTTCDDGDPNTENDLIQADCTCAGLPLAPGEICGNGIDDDGDGLIDCLDNDCCGTATCQIPSVQISIPEEDCGARIVITNFDPSLVYSISPTANFNSSEASFDILVAGTYLITASNACQTISSDVIQISNVNLCTEICNNNIDDDGDGLVDCVDSDCNNMLTITVEVSDSGCDLSSGRVEVTNFDPAVEYEISSNSVAARSSVGGVFEGLIPGSYLLVAIGICETISTQVSVSIMPGCGEICDNGIDDDGDGLVDCADPDCRRDLTVETEVLPSACDAATGTIGILNFDESLEYVLTSPTMPARRALGPFFNNLEANDYTLFALSQCDTLINNIVVGRDGCQEICDNDIDDDGDGLVDCADPDCSRDLAVETEVLPSACDVSTGAINILNFDMSLEYVLTSPTMPARTAISSSFDNLEANDYTLFTISLCDTLVSSIVVTQHACEEICDNGIDDDVDGLVDCADLECSTDVSCTGAVEGDCGPALSLNFATIDSGCDSTSAEIIITDYNPELTYLLTGSGSTFAERQGTFSGLTPGTYELSTTNNCDTSLVTGIVLNVEQGCESEGVITPRTVVAALDITLLLQGACVPEGGEMFTNLNDGGYLPGQQPGTFFGVATPAGQPFNEAPWFYEGAEGLPTEGIEEIYDYDDDVVDWILISLRTTQEKDSETWRAAALLYNDGHVEFFDDAELPNRGDSYFILIEHRNHLPMMSHEKIDIVDGMIAYDFTIQDSHTSLLGIGQIQDDFGNYMMVAGNGDLILELSSDIDINARDLTMWIQNNGANSSYFLEDYDMNGDVNIKDRIIWEVNNGLFTTLETK